jgi:hypothetical protein
MKIEASGRRTSGIMTTISVVTLSGLIRSKPRVCLTFSLISSLKMMKAER